MGKLYEKISEIMFMNNLKALFMFLNPRSKGAMIYCCL